MKQGEGKEIQVEALLTLVVKDYDPNTINDAIITPNDESGWVERIDALSVILV